MEATRLALALAQAEERTDLLPALEIRLRMYQDGRPYRDASQAGASLP